MVERDAPVTEEAPGVGQYIGRAVRVMTRGESAAMVDSNWVRVLHRVFDGAWMADYRYDPRLQALSQAVVDGARDSRVVNWAMLDVGATLCLPRSPRCAACPLAEACAYALHQSEVT
jgi:A/G-specific adenine glycosylase